MNCSTSDSAGRLNLVDQAWVVGLLMRASLLGHPRSATRRPAVTAFQIGKMFFGIGLGKINKHFLSSPTFLPFPVMTKGVAAVGLHIPRGAVVVFEHAQDLLQLLLDTGILHRHDALLAAEKVAPHPVGRAYEEFGIAPFSKR